MRLVHLSDPHLTNFDGVHWSALMRDKRVVGFLNLLLKRRRTHRNSIARQLARQLRNDDVDHVVVTGDLTNLALMQEHVEAGTWLRDHVGLPADRISIVPGNHDRYTPIAAASGHFEHILGAYLPADGANRFPYVRLVGPLALIGLDTALPQPPFVSAGQIGHRQLQRLRLTFDRDDVKCRTPVILLHHPPSWTRPWYREWLDGLRDAAALQAALPQNSGLLLHGHRHQTSCMQLRAGNARWTVVGAPSASDVKRAAYNIYEFDEAGTVTAIRSTRLGGEQISLLN